jgi:hypothetical protein
MTLIEAINSGRPFKRPNDRDYWHISKTGYIRISNRDYMYEVLPCTVGNLTATDWEVEEEEITITRDVLITTLFNALIGGNYTISRPKAEWLVAHIIADMKENIK